VAGGASAGTRARASTCGWRSGELGYALVSDLDAVELDQLAARFGG
jgi:anti-sigma factor RsiW